MYGDLLLDPAEGFAFAEALFARWAQQEPLMQFFGFFKLFFFLNVY